MINNFETYLKYLDNEKVKEHFMDNVYLIEQSDEVVLIHINNVNVNDNGVEIQGSEFIFWYNFDGTKKYNLTSISNDIILLKTEDFKKIYNASELLKHNSKLYYDVGRNMEDMKKSSESYDYESYVDLLKFINTIPDYKKYKNVKKFKI